MSVGCKQECVCKRERESVCVCWEVGGLEGCMCVRGGVGGRGVRLCVSVHM